MRLLLWMMFGCGSIALVACAKGTSDDASATFSPEGSGGSTGQGSTGLGGASTVSSTSGTSSSTVTSSSSTSAGAGGQGGGGEGGGTGGGGGAGGGSTCDYSAKETCLTATEITSIDGDLTANPPGSNTRTVKGSTSAWFKVLVKESWNLPTDLSYTATLVSPPGMVFQLFAYTGDGSMPNCLADAEVASGDPPSVSRTWHDNFGTSDSTWISLEVRYSSGSICDPSAMWTLTVEGYTNP